VKVFISWSGPRSGAVARALGEWLPELIQSVAPFVSSEDIYAGSRWQDEIATELDSTGVGIICVTADNQEKPWLNFEAGALGKAVQASRVIPLAIDLEPAQIKLPLGQFQAQPATEEGLRKIVASINEASGTSLEQST
jgi:hypothetical protein